MDNKITKIFGIGVSGLVGSRIAHVLQDRYSFDNLSLDTGVDITNPQTLSVIRSDKEHPAVLHLAAKADVDGCEKDKELGTEGAAYKINVNGTENVVAACKEGNKKIIYVSTDFVFDGENTPEGGYTETDIPHPINWYSETKYKGEEIVRNAGISFAIVRLAYPYQKEEFALKKDFVHAIVGELQNNRPIKAITDHIMTPTFLDDFAKGIGAIIENNATGIFHVSGSQSLTPYDAALRIAQTFGLDTGLVEKTTREEYFKDRAPRPFNLSMNNDKIEKLGVRMKTFDEALSLLL